MKTQNSNHTSGPFSQTRPSQRYVPDQFEPIHLHPKRRLPHPIWGLIFLAGLFILYLIFPSTNTVMILGIDRAIENTAIGRSDTNILLSVNTLSGKIKGISIPRDLWVAIPNYGENRINAAHYFGEGEAPGSGITLAMDTLEHNFQIRPDYFIRIQLEKFPLVIDALGGIDITLTEVTAGYPIGTHHLDGSQALAFVRDRSGTDDFSRMMQGQSFLRAFLQKLLRPAGWIRIPNLILASLEVIDTDIPLWQQPRLLIAGLRASLNNIELITISREMVTPWVTEAGAQVLLPRWELIRPFFSRTFAP